MAKHSKGSERTEPTVIPCLFCTGTEVQVSAHFARIVGWVDLPVVGSDTPEQRIIARLVMPELTFRELVASGQKALGKARK